MTSQQVQCCPAGPTIANPLGQFFNALVEAGDDATFHPHPLTAEYAVKVCSMETRDIYRVLIQGDQILAYGMLRGWEEGYPIPSLGIAVHPKHRGLGLGRLMMAELHSAARVKGADRVRLKVYKTNVNAVALYTSLGYEFFPGGGSELVGFKDLR